MTINDNSHIPVFIEGQDDLVDVLSVCMTSILYNTKKFIDFYILDCGINHANKHLLMDLQSKFSNFNIEFIRIDLNQFKGLKGWGAGNFVDCYSRLLIPELKKNLDRVIYLDSDIVAIDDINLLWQIDLEGYTYAAVPDLGYNKLIQEHCINNLGISPKHIYANAGVLILDTKRCREIGFSQKILLIAREKKDKLTILIEDLLSVFFGENNYKRLESRFNLTDRTNEIGPLCAQYINDKYLRNEWDHIVLQHLSPGKSWRMIKNNYNFSILKNFDLFWNYASMTPFYGGLRLKFQSYHVDALFSALNPQRKIDRYKLFGILPILKIKKVGNINYVYLFNKIPLLKIKRNV